MKIIETKIKSFKITDLERLDPINVFIENIELGKGNITIKCYGKSWTAYWGGMSNQTIEDFMLSASSDYLANCMWDHSKPQTEEDYKGISKELKSFVIDCRKKELISKEKARSIYSINNWHIYAPEQSYDTWKKPDDLCNEDFDVVYDFLEFADIPTKYTSGYAYLIRIIEAVQKALQHLKQKGTPCLTTKQS